MSAERQRLQRAFQQSAWLVGGKEERTPLNRSAHVEGGMGLGPRMQLGRLAVAKSGPWETPSESLDFFLENQWGVSWDGVC